MTFVNLLIIIGQDVLGHIASMIAWCETNQFMSFWFGLLAFSLVWAGIALAARYVGKLIYKHRQEIGEKSAAAAKVVQLKLTTTASTAGASLQEKYAAHKLRSSYQKHQKAMRTFQHVNDTLPKIAKR